MSKVIDEEEFDSVSSEEDEDNEVYDEEDDDYEYEEDDEELIDSDNNNKLLNYETVDEEQYENEDNEEQYEIEDNEPIENYLQKINDNMKSNIISDFHPQLKPHNYDEILLLTKIERDKNGDIIDDLHKTSPFMTKYECSRILSERTVQINSGAQSVLDEYQNEKIDGY